MAQVIEFVNLPPEKTQDANEHWRPDDDNLALELAPRIREYVRHFYSQWRGYEHGVWRVRHPAELRRYIREKLRDFRRFGVQVNQRRITSIVAMLEDELFLPEGEINAVRAERARYINLLNGLYNIETGKLEPHRPELYFTSQLDFRYDVNAACPTWHKYLRKSLVYPDGAPDHDLVALVTQALGYSMTSRTDLKASFWLVGEKDSGKSTFISVIKNIMGDLHTTIDLTQLGKNRFLLAGIVGKRVITFTEASEGTLLDDAAYKTLTGGSDDVHADVKNKDPISFRPEAKLWWAMNGMPRITDRSGATTRRITIIPFNRSIPADQRILNLEDQLMAERSGIFNEAVEHYQVLVAHGHFHRSEQSEAEMVQYIRENDTEATFIEQCAERHDSYNIRARALYEAYSSWCASNGFRPKNSNQVAKDWRRLGFRDRHSGGSVWDGLRLREPHN